MDFSLNESQTEQRQAIIKFGQEVLSPGAIERDQNSVFERELWEKSAEFGLAGLPIPEEYGGSGLNHLDTILALEALGYGSQDLGLVFSLCAHMFACSCPIWEQGTEEQKKRYLPGLCSGDLIAANAISEPASGSDVYAMATRVTKNGDGYILNGSKIYCTNGPVADLFVVYGTLNPEKGIFGITAFLVDKETPGLSVTGSSKKTGLRTSPIGEVYFDDMYIPATQRLGREGRGGLIFQNSMGWERGCLFAAYVGAMEYALEQATEHAINRKQFNLPIGKFQSVSNRLVDMKLRLEAARLLIYKTGWKLSTGDPSEQEIAMSKLFVAEAAVQSGLDAIQVFGGMGVMSESGVDALLRHALPARIFSGTSEIQRNIIAATMGL